MKATKKEVEKIVALVKNGKVRWAGDISLYKPSRTDEEHKEKMENPQFTEVKVSNVWIRWGKGKRGNNGGFTLTWGAKGVGFGEVSFSLDRKNKLHCRSECMGRDFVKKALMAMVDQCVWDE